MSCSSSAVKVIYCVFVWNQSYQRLFEICNSISYFVQPNCYSRFITVSGDVHIIIFAKRDIKQWEELTYDYRFDF